MKVSLIVPVAKDTKDQFPYLFSLNNEGLSLCVKAVLGLPLNEFSNIYFVVLKKHNDMFNVRVLLEMQFKRLKLKNAKVVLLDESTSSEPETVYKAIKKEGISGACFIKDADGYFECKMPLVNGISVYSLEDADFVIHLKNKSFVFVDDNFYITNIIEKKIISKYINTGGYFFENIDDFIGCFERLDEKDGLYLSHIIYALLLERKQFRPIECTGFEDWGDKSIVNCFGVGEKCGVKNDCKRN